MLYRNEPHPRIIFASPHIPNPDIYLELVPNAVEGDRTKFVSSYTPVSQEKFLIDLQAHELGYYNSLTEELHIINNFTPDRDFQSFLVELGRGKKNLVKACPKRAIKDRNKYAELIDETYTLTADVLLSSPSAAASFVGGASLSGNFKWKDENGVSLGELEKMSK